MKITNFEIENVKKVSLVRMNVSPTGMTVIGGRNAQGKSSVLDAIMYGLGGEKFRPDNLQNTEGMAPARIRIGTDNHLVIERKGKNASLTVTDATGKKAGQALLNEFIEELALNLPKFLNMSDTAKAEVLLRTLGIEDQLKAIAIREQAAYDQRHDYGVIRDQKRKYAAELPEYADVPEALQSAGDIIREINERTAINAERAQKRIDYVNAHQQHELLMQKNASLQAALEDNEDDLVELEKYMETLTDPEEIPELSMDDLEEQLDQIEEVNIKVRANLDKEAALEAAEVCDRHYDELTAAVDAVREERKALLDGAKMPLADLTIGKNSKGVPVLLYKGQTWDGMSGMERIKVGTAIVQALKPECKFILLDGMEAFDSEQLESFDKWLTELDLQAICTRVGSDHASIIIENGYAVDETAEPAPEVPDMMAPIPMNNEEEQDF